jgi:hypothetical protein
MLRWDIWAMWTASTLRFGLMEIILMKWSYLLSQIRTSCVIVIIYSISNSHMAVRINHALRTAPVFNVLEIIVLRLDISIKRRVESPHVFNELMLSH